jgi:hypothetical protein
MAAVIALLGTIQHVFENVKIRHFEADGTRTNGSGNTIGDTRLYRMLLSMAEVNAGVGKEGLASINVFVHPTISGIRVKPSVIEAFKKAHKRDPRTGDRISFTSNGDICAPVDRRIGNGQYVVKTQEAEDLSAGTKDCVLEYTGITGVTITPVDETEYDSVASQSDDVEELPW